MNILDNDVNQFKVVEKLCHTCLCGGRTLQPILDQASVKFYLDSINEIPLSTISTWNTPCPDVCWECRALLRKLVSFRQRIQDSHRLLQAYSNKNIEELLANGIVRPSGLSVQYNQSVDISPAIEIDEQVDEESVQSVFVKNEAFEIVKDEAWEIEKVLKREVLSYFNEDSNSLNNYSEGKTNIELKREVLCYSNEDSNSLNNYSICNNSTSLEGKTNIEIESEKSSSLYLQDVSKSQEIVPAANKRKRGRPKRVTNDKRDTNECDRDGRKTLKLRDGKKKRNLSSDVGLKKICDIDSPRGHGARVECGACDKTFSHRAGLLNHTGVVHRQLDKFPCERCGKVFKWRNSLRKHAEKHDKTNKTADSTPFCVQCDVSFASICSYKRHLRNSLKHVSQNQLKFVCDHCQQRYANKTKLRDHIEEKHLKRTFHCNICLKPSKNRVCLDQHIRNVHKGRPNNKICQYCGKGFPTKMQLESHIRAHTGERPFICEYCPTTFSQQSNLYKHYRQIHLNKLKSNTKNDVLSDVISISDVGL